MMEERRRRREVAVLVVTHTTRVFNCHTDRPNRFLSLLPLTTSQDTNRLADERLCAICVRRKEKENEEIEEEM